MREKNILFFADSCQETSSFLESILKVSKGNGLLLSSFMEGARLALQDELSYLPSTQRATLPNFQSFDCFLGASTQVRDRHPALRLLEVVFVQLAYFINAYERAPKEPYPSEENSICVGTCFGIVTATAVALSASLTDLIPLAVDAIRIAFRGGILASSVGNNIEHRNANQGSWALSIPRDTNLHSSENLLALHERLQIPPHKRAWTSALGNNTVTLAGPPSTLNLITKHLDSQNDSKASALRRLPIYAPYHAGHLFVREETNKLLSRPSALNSLTFHHKISEDQRRILIGGSRQAERTLASHMFEDVLHEIFANPIDWKAIKVSCKEILDQHCATSCRIRAFGPDLQGQSLASGLQKQNTEGVTFDTNFGRLAEEVTSSPNIPLAIVGMAGRFPSASSPDQFWKILSDGIDCVQEVPDDRFDKTVHFKDKIWGCFIDKPALFDPRFFHMSPREAVNTDPAHRIGLTTVHEALEMAGIVPGSTSSTDPARIGTFWGNATEEYKEEYMSQHVDPYYIPGSSRAFAPGRVNFVYEFDGPAVSFDTACSSSLVALNHACNSVWNGDCGTAIVVGSNILTAPYSYKGLDLGHFLSKTGGCKSFDEYADGYCRGEAVGTIVIKKLPDAIADNDNILGVIRAISTNHSSHSSSITRPHGPTQEKLFQRLLDQANLSPSDISYAEMHGTGTQAGDTVEMTSVANALAPEPRSKENPLYLGAVKANIGHGEGASGITSLIKCLLMLREQKIPPHVGIKSGTRRREPDVSSKNIHIATSLVDWEAPTEAQKGLRRVMISNFSAAGGNTSMILEEARPRQPEFPNDYRTHHVITVSGKTEKSLRENMRRLSEWTKLQPQLNLSNLAYTTNVRRTRYEFGHSVVVSSPRDLEKKLDSDAELQSSKDRQSASVNVVFTGYTNTSSPAMHELYETSSFFRSEVSRLDQSVQRLGYETIAPFFDNGDKMRLTFTQRQLGYVVSQVAMYKLIQSWGVLPTAITGHSLGEYVALCASGIISPDDMIYIVGFRAVALEQRCNLESHGMLAVRASLREAQQHLGSEFTEVEVSCINGPSDIVLSGPIPKLQNAETILKGKQIQCSRVDTPLAFHSSQMDAIGDDLLAAQSFIRFNDAHTKLLSPTEGTVITTARQLGSDYFKRHTRGTVDFCGVLSKHTQDAAEPDVSTWLEIGPHGICSAMIKSTLGSKTRALSLMKREESIWVTAPRALSLLYNTGHNIDWKEYHREIQGLRLLEIPPHVLEEQHYWLPRKERPVAEKVEETAAVEQPRVSLLDVKVSSKSVHKLVSRSIQDGFIMLAFETDLLAPHLYEVMQGHMMNGSYLCPASLYTDIAFTIGQYLIDNEFEVQPNFRPCVADLGIHKPIIAPHSRVGATLGMRIVAHTDVHDKRTKLRFETKSPNSEDVHIHAQCQVYFEKKQDWIAEWSREEDDVLRSIGNLEANLFRGLSQKLLSGLVYRLFDNVVVYGDKFRSLKEVMVDETQLQGLASVELYQGSDCNGYLCCPYWMDGLAHLAGFLINGLRQGSEKAVYISPGWNNFRLAEPIDPERQYKSYVKLQDHGSTVNAECYILFGNRIVGKVDGLNFQMLPRSIIDRILPPGGKHHQSSHRALIIHQENSDSSSQGSDTGVGTPDTYVDSSEDAATKVIDLAAILYEETGVDAGDIHDETEIADLGIDSLLSLTISDRLREEYGLHSLPANLFQISPTFGALEQYIRSITVKAQNRNNDTVTTEMTSFSSEKSALPNSKPPLGAPGSTKDSGQLGQLEQVRKVIAEQMGLKAAELSSTDDLFDLGLDSLMSLEIVEALRTALGFELDAGFFMSASTLEQVDKALFQSTPPVTDMVLDNKPTAPREPGQKLSIVLQGNPETCAKKLFLFPDGSGAANVYARLPIIDEKICVYGLISPYLKKGVISNLTISSFVSQWISEVRDCQPQGPYHLGGYSSGGYYAYEAAKVLLGEKHSVETLICIDTPSRSTYDALPEDVLESVSSCGVIVDGEGSTPAWLVDHFRSSIQAISGYQPTPIQNDSEPKTYLIWAESGIDELKSTLVSKNKFNSGIVNFFAGTRGPLRPHGWSQLITRKNIRMAKTSGNHFSIMHVPNKPCLRDLLAAAMARREEAFLQLPGAVSDLSSIPHWQPHCAALTVEQLQAYMGRTAPASEILFKHQLNLLVSLYVRQVLGAITEVESRELAPHFQRFYRWMQSYAQVHLARELPDEDIKSLEADIAGTGVDGALLHRIGHNILPIIRGQIQPLGLMLKDHLLFEYYPKAIHTAPCFPLVNIVVRRELSLSKPLNILEIGAGTGGTTKAVFRAIAEFESSEGPIPGFGHYTYTDVSAGFFKQAKDTFKSFVPRMAFKKLDIQESPSSQGFETEKYDLIVASQCLHATKNMTETMRNVRQLLKPGGKLVMVEGTREAPDISFIFGTLPGWWLGVEENRQLTPCLDLPHWTEVLRATGFNGTDIVVPNCDSDVDHSLSLIVSIAI